MESRRLQSGVVLVGVCLAFFLAGQLPASGQQPQPVSPRATSFFGNKQYNDVIKVLLEEIKDKGESQCGKHFLMLGESYYLTGQHEAAWSHFVKAQQNLPEGRDRVMAEYRLAICAYRLNDLNGAIERIDAFVTKRPDEALVGKLLAYKMLILARKGATAAEEIVRIHERIQQNVKKYDYTTGMEADQILCDFYRKIGQEEKAQGVYSRIVQNFAQVIAEMRAGGQPVPVAYEKVHDNAALQLGVMCLEKKQRGEAVRWLENVRYDLVMKQKARLLLAKSAFERRDFNAVLAYLTEPGFMDAVPSGALRSDMFLLLGLAEKNRPGRDAGRAEGWLKRVEPGAKGYVQAQAALADMYREANLYDNAVKAYLNVVNSPDHAADALFQLGSIYLEQATNSAAQAMSEALYRKSADMFSQLCVKYPLSPLTKQAREKAEILGVKGIDISFARNDDDNLKTWEKTAQDKKGTMEGAQALMSIVRLQIKSLADEKTGKLFKAPNYAACAAACDRLLDEKAYNGTGFEERSWKSLKAEILYVRGQCEIASAARSAADQAQEVKPVYLENAGADAAIALFTRARELADPKQLDFVKGIEISLLESLFKSDKKEDRDTAEKRFGQLEADYGTDARFQKLAMDLADWYQDQRRYTEAAKQYAGVADRGKSMAEEDALKLRYTAGTLYSKAAFEAQELKNSTNFAVYIYPKEVIELGDDIRKTHEPLMKTVQVPWPKGGQEIPARDALMALSKTAGIAFVWRPEKGQNTIVNYLHDKRVSLKDGSCVVQQALDQILDPNVHRLAFDIGLTGGKPTIERPPASPDDPEAGRSWKVIEIYDARQIDSRCKPLARGYGAWNRAHRGRSVLLFSILQRIEEITGMRVLWAEGIEKQEKLAVEYKEIPGVPPNSDARCAQVLTSVLDPQQLRYKIIRREVALDLYEAAKDQFNKIRQVNPRSRYGERSLFSLALNFYNVQDFEKMKIVLREYLKLFDNSSYEHYRQACFWVGWAFENEKRYREACDYYARATEERLVLYKPGNDEKIPPRAQLKSRLSYDTQFALMEKANGDLKDKRAQDLADFIRLNAHVDVRLEGSAQTIEGRISRDAFRALPMFDLLAETLEQLGLSFRVENVEPEIAERAFYRMASAYRKDNLMPQALENCTALLTRYPDTARRQDTYKLMLDIYKGLKDYRNVLNTLEELKKVAGDEIEKYKLDFEMASIYFDMADYARAADTFKKALLGVNRADEKTDIRDAYARALFRNANLEEALAHYETLAREDREPTRAFVDGLMAFYLKFALSKAEEKDFPAEAEKYIETYEKLTAAERDKLTPPQFAKATWIYYVKALVDLKKGRQAPAAQELNAAMNSPDDSLAAEAAYRLGLLHMEREEYEQARQVFEYLLFATRSSESAVRATYALGLSFQKLGRQEKAAQRFAQLEQRYPVSPYVELIRKNASKPEAPEGTGARPADSGASGSTNTVVSGTTNTVVK